jgi:hypothetical protein
MSNELLVILVINSFAFVAQYISAKIYIPQRNYRDDQIDYLCEKICRLEKQVLNLEQELEDIQNGSNFNSNKCEKLEEQDLFNYIKNKKLDDYIEYDDVI